MKNFLHENLSYESFFARKFPDLRYLSVPCDIDLQQKLHESFCCLHSSKHGNYSHSYQLSEDLKQLIIFLPSTRTYIAIFFFILTPAAAGLEGVTDGESGGGLPTTTILWIVIGVLAALLIGCSILACLSLCSAIYALQHRENKEIDEEDTKRFEWLINLCHYINP